jgi:hypothetical protein
VKLRKDWQPAELSSTRLNLCGTTIVVMTRRGDAYCVSV